MTRAFRDQWSKTKVNEEYKSAIAEICHTFASASDKSRVFEYIPKKATDDARAVKDAYQSLKEMIEDFSIDELEGDEDFSLPLSRVIANKDIFGRVRVNVSTDDLNDLTSVPLDDDEFSKLLRLVIFGNYLINRVFVKMMTMHSMYLKH
jgi:hypothetical protein